MVMAGKQHTSLGYWHNEYHHGKQLFLTVDRPFFLNFEDEGGIIPMHITGLNFEGSWKDSFARFRYDINIGNGPHINQTKRELMPNVPMMKTIQSPLSCGYLPGLTAYLV